MQNWIAYPTKADTSAVIRINLACCAGEAPHPRATARVPTPLHATPALTKTTKREWAGPCLCKGGCGEDEGMGPLRSPWGGALPPAQHANLTPMGRNELRPYIMIPFLFSMFLANLSGYTSNGCTLF